MHRVANRARQVAVACDGEVGHVVDRHPLELAGAGAEAHATERRGVLGETGGHVPVVAPPVTNQGYSASVVAPMSAATILTRIIEPFTTETRRENLGWILEAHVAVR